ncbi:MAG: hypothetical protein Q8P02_01715, partial [Candidatus Micrarchaeota archaeon]|nr:hypothetical protein [Candidatus Micrarchaeota archaeon]
HTFLVPNSFAADFPGMFKDEKFTYKPTFFRVSAEKQAAFVAGTIEDTKKVVTSPPSAPLSLGAFSEEVVTLPASIARKFQSGEFIGVSVPYGDSDEQIKLSVQKGVQSVTAQPLGGPAPAGGDSGADPNAVAKAEFEPFSTLLSRQTSEVLDLRSFGMKRTDKLQGLADASGSAPDAEKKSFEFDVLKGTDSADNDALYSCIDFTPEYRFAGNPQSPKDDDAVTGVVLTAFYTPATCNACGEGETGYKIKWTPKIGSAAGKYVLLDVPIQCNVDYVVGFASDADDGVRKTLVDSVLPSSAQDSVWPALARGTFALAADESPFTGTAVTVPVYENYDALAKHVKALAAFFSDTPAKPPAKADGADGGGAE